MGPTRSKATSRPRETSLAELGTRFKKSWSQLFSAEGADIRRPTELSREWNLEQTLCTRLFQALGEPNPMSAVQKLPAVTSLRAVMERARKKVSQDRLVRAALDSLEDLESAIELAGGTKSNLDILCARHQRDAREKVERKAKQQAFRGMASLLGVHARASFVQTYVFPSADEGWCDELALHGFQGLQRFRPELPVLLGVRESVPNDDDEMGVVIKSMLGEDIDDQGLMTAIQPFCSHPMPDIELREEDGKLLYMLRASDQDLLEEVDLSFASIQRRGEPLYAQENHERARFAYVPNTPAEDVVFDLFVHEDVWPDQTPEFALLRTGDPSSTDLAAHSLDRLDLVEGITDLGKHPSSIPFSACPKLQDQVAYLHERMGWKMGSFRLYRVALRHPVMGFWYSMQLKLPSAPS